MHAGALVISTGSASAGASTSNTGTVSTNHKTNNGDKDMQDINSKIYSQPLNDLALLTFDIVPTASGAIYFRCVCVCVCARVGVNMLRQRRLQQWRWG